MAAPTPDGVPVRMTSPARAWLDYGFDVLGLREVVSFTYEGNAPSRALMERLGFKLDPDGSFMHPRVPPGHPIRPHVLYRMSK